jgi:hypothetical protein
MNKNNNHKYDELVKSYEFNYGWLSKKVYPPLAAPEATRVHIQGVVFFQERGYTCSMPSACKNTTTHPRRTSAVDGTFYDAIKY